MKRLFFAVLLLITIFSVKAENYYDFIGIDAAALQQIRDDAENAVNTNPEYQKMYRDMTAGKITPADIQPLIAKIRAPIVTNKIAQYCETAREKLLEELEKAQEESETAQGFEKAEKFRAAITAERRYKFSLVVCKLLADPKQRAEYDRNPLSIPNLEISDDQIFNSARENLEAALAQPPGKAILLNQIIGDLLSQIGDIPGPAAKIFNQNLELRSVNFLPMPSGSDIKYGLGFSGLIALNSLEARLSVYLIQDIYGAFKFSFIVEPPQSYKISSLLPSLSFLDSFKFPKTKFILASFDGSDSDGYPFKRGFNFGAMVDLEGPFKILSDLKDRSSSLKSLVFESKPIILSGLIPKVPYKATFKMDVPMHIGIDLRKIAIIPKALSDVINRITTDDFTVDILPVLASRDEKGKERERSYSFEKKELIEKDVWQAFKELETTGDVKPAKIKETSYKDIDILGRKLAYRLQARTGVRFDLGTQSAPIRLGMTGAIIPISSDYPSGMLSVTGRMDNKLELKWLAFGNTAISLDFDNGLMAAAAALGIPFTGIGIRGQIDLGKQGDARIAMNAAGGFRVKSGVTSGPPVDLVFDLSAENIRLANIASYATELAVKAKLIKQAVPVARIPTLTFHKLAGYCAFSDTEIAGRRYNAGLSMTVDTEFFDRKAGFSIFMDDKFRLSGSGYMPPINWSVKGQEVFRLTGLSSDKGPRISFGFDPAEPLKGRFLLQSIVAIPALALKQKVDLSWAGSTLSAEFESQFAEFSVLFGLRMNTLEGTAMVSQYDELLAEAAALYETADQNHPEVIAAKKMIEDIGEFMRLKEYDKVQQLLEAVKNKLKAHQKYFVVANLDTPELDQMTGQVEALKVETEYLLAAMNQGSTAYNIANLRRNKAVEMDQSNQASLQSKIEYLTKVKKYIQTALGNRLKAVQKQYEIERVKAEQNAPSPLLKPLEGLVQKFKEGKQDTAPSLLRKKQVVVDSSQKWQKLAVRFGFRGDFGAFLSKYAVQTLQKMRDNALKKLDEINEKMASLANKSVEVAQLEIERSKADIAKYQQEIDAMKKECSSLPYYKQAGCRSKILAHQSHVKAKQGYLNLLLKPGKHVVRGITGGAVVVTKAITQNNALRSATEGVLSVALAGMDMIAKGASIINVKEVRGEYTWDDMQSLKLPKLEILVASLALPEEIMPPMEIVLRDLQFDFKDPARSAGMIVQSIMTALLAGQQNKYVRYAVTAFE